MAETKFPDSVPDEFWAIIDEAKQNHVRFRELLKGMNRGKLIRFFWTYEELANRIRTEEYYRHADPSLSEDGMWELANWVVAQGKDYYGKVFRQPESIPSKKNDVGFVSQLVLEYEERYGGDLPLNTHSWDDQWKEHGKGSPWS